MDILSTIEKNVNKNLKIKNFEERKMKTEKVVNYYELLKKEIVITPKKIGRIINCGNFLEFIADKDIKNKKLVNANFCRDRFCPICSKNLAVKNALAIQVMTEYIHEEEEKEFIFLTLTAPNVTGDNLKSEIQKFSYALNSKLLKYKDVKQVVKGYVKKLEVTYNAKQDTYHTHYHILIAVDKSYFNSRCYLSQDKWLKLWQKAMKDDRITQVDVRRAKNKSEKIFSYILEICKYIAKDNDYLTSKEVFKTYYTGLKGARMLSFGGIFKDARKKFKNGELDKYLNQENHEWIYKIVYEWSQDKKYKLTKFEELTEEEKFFMLKNYFKDLDEED